MAKGFPHVREERSLRGYRAGHLLPADQHTRPDAQGRSDPEELL